MCTNKQRRGPEGGDAREERTKEGGYNKHTSISTEEESRIRLHRCVREAAEGVSTTTASSVSSDCEIRLGCTRDCARISAFLSRKVIFLSEPLHEKSRQEDVCEEWKRPAGAAIGTVRKATGLVKRVQEIIDFSRFFFAQTRGDNDVLSAVPGQGQPGGAGVRWKRY